MLTNFDIENICDYYQILLLGVAMKDELPMKVTDGNLSSKKERRELQK